MSRAEFLKQNRTLRKNELEIPPSLMANTAFVQTFTCYEYDFFVMITFSFLQATSDPVLQQGLLQKILHIVHYKSGVCHSQSYSLGHTHQRCQVQNLQRLTGQPCLQELVHLRHRIKQPKWRLLLGSKMCIDLKT